MTGARSDTNRSAQPGLGHWRVDASTSVARFTVRDKMFATVHGRMPIVDGVVDVVADGTARGRLTLHAAGIETGIAKRDEHVCSPGFLDAGTHPHVVVDVGTARQDGAVYVGDGTLSARGRSAPLQVTGEVVWVEGDDAMAMVTARFDRKPLGMTVPTFIVGRYLEIEVELRAHRA